MVNQMYKFTDVDFTVTAQNAHFLTARKIRINLAQEYVKFEVPTEHIDVVSDTVLTFYLTQEETGLFSTREKCYIQINYLNSAGKRVPTNIKPFDVFPNLLNEVMHE